MPDFSTRSSDIEIMDDLAIDGEVVPKTLRELEIINSLLGGNRVTISGIQQLINKKSSRNSLVHIVDMGCGGGDMLKLIANWAKRNEYKVKLTGIDANPNIINYASQNSEGYNNIEYVVGNVFDSRSSIGDCDIIISTLFMHHFDNQQLTFLLSDWTKKSRLGVVINDLHRHPFAYHSIKLLTTFFSKSYMVKNDGPLSVLRSFTKDDLQELMDMVGITNFDLKWRWAFRWRLVVENGITKNS